MKQAGLTYNWRSGASALIGLVAITAIIAMRSLSDSTLIISQKQFTTPVLKGKADNPVLRIHLRVTEPNRTIAGFTFSTTGTTNLKDLKHARVFYCGRDSVLEKGTGTRTGSLFGVAERISNTFTIAGNQLLEPGDHYFWLSYELADQADLLHVVDAACTGVKTEQTTLAVRAPAPGITQRIGLALRKHMDDQVHTFRIPGMATTNQGTLLAIYDVRRESARDLQGDIDIGLSRSTDGGNTWEPMRIVLDKGTWGGLPQKFNGVSDACILVDRQSNTIYVAGLWMYGVKNDQGQWVEGLQETSKDWNHQWRTKGSQPGFDVKQTAQFLLTKSTDDGKTWSEPVNLTQMCKQEDWWLWAPAPGHGITLTDGTLVFPTQGRDNTGEPFSNITYSRDKGKTWKTSPKAYNASTTENMAVELSDGSVMLNMRANKNRTDPGETNGRAIAVTRNLGETWQVHPTSFRALPEPTCMASIHRHDYTAGGRRKSLLVFANPASRTARDHITVKVSFDDGMTWPEKNHLLLDELKGRGYSCLTSVDEKTVGIIYESSQADMVFQKIPLAELLK